MAKGVKGDSKGSLGVRRGYREIQEVTMGYRWF